jgi:FkbM family methyltransferase
MKNFVLYVYRTLFANTLFFKLNYTLYLISLRGLGILNYENSKVSGEDWFIKKTGYRFKSPVIIDVGGNEGDYAALCKKYSPDAKIISFEPHPKTFERLKLRSKKLNFEVINAAVSNVHETVILYDLAGQEGTSHASLYAGVVSDIHRSEVNQFNVPALPLDDYLSKNAINHVTLLKIDAEGHELKILQGAQQYLSLGKIDIVHFEFNEMNVVSKTFMKDFYDILHEYSFFRLLPNGMLPLGNYQSAKCEIFLYQNIIAIRKGLKF